MPEHPDAATAATAGSPLLAWPGAVQAGWPDEGVAAHYGDPVREQRALDGGAASSTGPTAAC